MRKFEYCHVSIRRDITKEGWPWTDELTLSEGLETRQITSTEGKGLLNFMGSQGWELLGPPEVTRVTKTAWSYNWQTTKADLVADWADVCGYKYYFKREVEG